MITIMIMQIFIIFYNMDNTINNIKGDNDVIVISFSVHQTKMC